MTTISTEIELDMTALSELSRSFEGEFVRPGDRSYEEQRKVWNGSIDRFPALIARCAGVADVVEAVRFARATGLVVAVRGGGHSFPGLSVCDGGIVIDLGLMKGIRVDPTARTARAQAGVLLGDLDRETQALGLAVPSGIVTHTGLSGLTLGGGSGWLMRKYGLTIDQLVSVDLVTADGERLKASEAENADLNISGMTETADGFDHEKEWVRSFWSALEPHHTSVYVNFLMEEGEERTRQAYGAEKYERLKALKRRYDPDNFFRLNQNIPPA